MPRSYLDTPALARRCRSLRAEHGLTQDGLAERLVSSGYADRITKQAISQAENDTIGSNMNALRVAIIEELTGRSLVGPVWIEEP